MMPFIKNCYSIEKFTLSTLVGFSIEFYFYNLKCTTPSRIISSDSFMNLEPQDNAHSPQVKISLILKIRKTVMKKYPV